MKPQEASGSVSSILFLLAPALVLVVLILFLPTAYVAIQSFFDWHPNRPSPFVGFENYTDVLTSEAFQTVIWNQFFLMLGLPLWIFIPLFISFLLYEDVLAPGVWRTLYFLPAVLSPALIGIQFRTILGNDGVLNTWLKSVGLERLALNWLMTPELVKPIIILLVLWAGIGTGVVIFSAALSAVPVSIFDAAQLDGVGWLPQLVYIVIPSIKDTIYLWGAFQLLSLFLFMFSWVFVLTGGGPGLSSTTIDFLIYQEVFRFGFFPTAAAMAVLLILILVIILAASALILGRRDGIDI